VVRLIGLILIKQSCLLLEWQILRAAAAIQCSL